MNPEKQTIQHAMDEPETEAFGNERNGPVWTGILLLIIGAVALARSFDVPMPRWLFTWQALLILIGIFSGLKNNFRGPGWLIIILVGTAFLLNDFYFRGELRRHLWPLLLIVIGAVFLFRPRNRKRRWNTGGRMTRPGIEVIDNNENVADITVIFGSAKKNMLTQHFAGGDIISIFGSVELDLSQADLPENAVIDITTIFGGADLIIPAHWAVKSQVTTILGSVRDERAQTTLGSSQPQKVLVLEGTAFMGGIKIRSFQKTRPV